MFRVEFAVHLTYQKGVTTFRREEQLPFVPFVGLDILDDALGEFHLEHVAWHAGSQLFLCQASKNHDEWSLGQACRFMGKAKWEEDREARRRL